MKALAIRLYMCGILFLHTKNGGCAAKAVLKRFRKQRERGTEGFGYVTIDKDGYVGEVVRSADENEILADLMTQDEPTIMFHHRLPTSIPNYAEAAHPLTVKDDRFQYDYYVIHNGMITNWSTLFEKFKKDNYVFMTELRTCEIGEFVNVPDSRYDFDPEIKINDSEAFALDLAMYLEGKQDGIEAIGTISFICIQAHKSGKVKSVIYGHNVGNPMVQEVDKTLFCLRSLGQGGSTKEVPIDKIYTIDWETQQTTVSDTKVGYRYHSDKYPSAEGYGVHHGAGFRTPVNVPSRNVQHSQNEEDKFRVLDPKHPVLLNSSTANEGIRYFGDDPEPVIDLDKELVKVGDKTFTFSEWETMARIQDDMSTADAVNDILKELSRDSQDDEDAVKELRASLRREREDLDDADSELQAAKKLLAESVKQNSAKEEKDEALSMVEAAFNQWQSVKRVVDATIAELSFYDKSVR